MLRLEGRLQESQLGFEERHPAILPKNSHFTEILVRHVHHLTLHGGGRDTLARLRTKFWVLQGRQLIKKILSKCIECKKYNTRPLEQEMAPLPADRVTQSPPFSVVGIDFTGPLYAKSSGGVTKMYIAIFTCAVTRAVHLEVVPSISTSSFMQAFRRFVARRGVCSVVYSDNARTFKRADKDISEAR